MVKVCFFIFAIDYSGAEIVLDRYLEDNEEINPYFILIYKNDKIKKIYVEKYGEKNVYSLNLNHNKNILRFFPWIDINKVNKYGKSIIEKIRPDIIYANNTHEMMLTQKLIRNVNSKSIAHIHDMKQSIKSPVKRRCMDKALNKFDKVITVSKATKVEWKNEDINIIYNGISKDDFVKDVKEKSCIKTIGFVGKISERKGFDILIDAYNSQLRDKELLIAYGSYEERFKDIIETLKKEKNVKVSYKLDSNEIKKFFDNVDLLVVPSREDPLPTVIMEAMARGCLIIGAKTGGISELLGNEELLFESNSVDALREKISQILELDNEIAYKYRLELYNRGKKYFDHKNKVTEINYLIKALTETI